MNIEQRIQKFQESQQLAHGTDETGQISPVSVFPETRLAIVDGTLVEVLGLQSHYPGMSPVFWIIAPTADGRTRTLPVSVNDVELISAATSLGTLTRQLSGRK